LRSTALLTGLLSETQKIEQVPIRKL